jgi:hypothetical protein
LKLEAEFCFFQTGKMFLEIGGLYLKIRLWKFSCDLWLRTSH